MLFKAVNDNDFGLALKSLTPSIFNLIKGADVNAKNKSGNTPLIIASEKGSKNMIQLLIDRGADINLRDKSGIHP